MDVLTPAWTDLKGAINHVWPEINAIIRVTQMQKRNWFNLLTNGELAAPWVVVHLPAAVDTDDYGVANQTYEVTPTVYYIAADDGVAIAGTLEAKAALLQDYLLTGAFSFLVLSQGMEIDASDDNMVNIAFRESDNAYSSCSLKFMGIAGFGPAFT